MSTYGYDALYSLWTTYGGNRTYADIAAAIALAESGGDTRSVSTTNDYGLWQINIDEHPEYRDDPTSLFDPATNVRAAMAISSGGSNWRPWCTAYSDGACGSRGGVYLGAGAPFYGYLHGTLPSSLQQQAPTGTSYPTLQVGSSGAFVTKLQQFLNQAGYGTLATDGQFGPATEAAVKSYQHDHGLTADGVVGPKTWAVITSDQAWSSNKPPPGVTATGVGPEVEGPGSRLLYADPGSLPSTRAPSEPFPGTPSSLHPAQVPTPARPATGSTTVGSTVPTGLGATGVPSGQPAEPQRADGVVFAKGLPTIEAQANAKGLTDNAQIKSIISGLEALGP